MGNPDLAKHIMFAFALQQYPGERGESSRAAVRAALAQARIQLHPEHMYAEQLDQIGTAGHKVHRLILDMPKYERASLIAVHSRCWESKRLAVSTLHDYFKPLLARQVDDQELLGKLVTRHYIAQRERGSGWAQADLVEEFNIGMDRLTRAIATLDRHAKELDHAAMQTLAAHIEQEGIYA